MPSTKSRTVSADADAVLGDRGAADPLVDDDVAALRAQCRLHGRRHDVDAPEQRRPSVLFEYQLLRHGRVPPYSRMARTSSSRRMRYSLSSILTSEPEYLPNRILSPAFTSSGIFLPSSPTFPVPAALTLPSCAFSFAVPGMMIPPRRTSCSSTRSTRMRSCSGRIFMVSLPPWCFVDVALASAGDGVTILQRRLPVSTQFQRVLDIRAK